MTMKITAKARRREEYKENIFAFAFTFLRVFAVIFFESVSFTGVCLSRVPSSNQ
jgi:hypothetical protein